MRVKEVVAQRLRDLYKQHGEITPEIVVEDARDKRSPLHEEAGFEWDIKKAAYNSWIEHARDLIANVEIEVAEEDHGTEFIPVYIRDPRKPPQTQGYRSLEALRSDRSSKWRQLAFANEISQIRALLHRTWRVAIGLGIGKKVKGAISEIEKLLDRMEKAI